MENCTETNITDLEEFLTVTDNITAAENRSASTRCGDTFAADPIAFALFTFFAVLINFLAWILRNKDERLDENARSIITFLNYYIAEYVNVAALFFDVPLLYRSLVGYIPVPIGSLARYIRQLLLNNALVLYAIMSLAQIAAAHQMDIFMDSDQKSVAQHCGYVVFGLLFSIFTTFFVIYHTGDEFVHPADVYMSTSYCTNPKADYVDIINITILSTMAIISIICNIYLKTFLRREGISWRCNCSLRSPTVGAFFGILMVLLICFCVYIAVDILPSLTAFVVINLFMICVLAYYVFKDLSFAVEFLKSKVIDPNRVESINLNMQQLDVRSLDDGGVYCG